MMKIVTQTPAPIEKKAQNKKYAWYVVFIYPSRSAVVISGIACSCNVFCFVSNANIYCIDTGAYTKSIQSPDLIDIFTH